ncbi:MAG: TonB-dependent receptor [Blastocatellia bacterium]|nr:TonB-dependent receptor [Blastocatellia bacterium]
MIHRLVLLLLLCGVAAYAQTASSTSAVTGVVLDQNDAVISGAQVTLQEMRKTTRTDEAGKFRFDRINTGEYQLFVTREGFKAETVRLILTARPLAPLRIVLTVADVQQEIVVSENSTQVSTEAASNQDVASVDRQMLDTLPSLGQDYIGTMAGFLNAGAMGTGGATLIVDGMEAVKAGVSASGIQEVRINNNPYSAEYARPGRARIEIITKPGGAQYHGTFNFLFRDYRLNARDPFALTRPPEQRRIYEGNLIGPIGNGKKTVFVITANREEDDLQSVIFARTASGDLRQNFPNPTRNTEFSGRISHQITDKSTFAAFYSFQDRVTKNQGVGGFNLPEVATNTRFREDIARFSHNWIVSPKLVNQTQLLLGRYIAPTESVRQAQRIVVQEAFTGGGAQADFNRTEEHWTFSQILTYSSGKHVVKAGVQVPDFSRRGINDQTNKLGTFFFSSLADYQQSKPFAFVQQQGRTKVIFWEMVLGAFVQNEIRMRPDLSIAVGLRYDWQNYFNEDSNNFNPRLSIAWAADKVRKTVVRTGFGFFYDRTGPGPISDLLRFDGERLRRYVITNPSFPNPLANGQTLGAQPNSIVRLAPATVIPFILQYSVGVERQLQKTLALTASYIGTRGVNSFRSRDVNAPLPPLFATRPDPNFMVIRQIESTGRMAGHALEVGLRGNVTRYFNGMLQYVFGHAWNDTSGINAFPANSYDLTGEWGRADFDIRHRFNLLGTVKAGKFFNLGMNLALNTGAPYTLTTGRDNNRDSQTLDRPMGVGRNTLEGPGIAQLDLRWSRDVYLTKAKKDKGPMVTLALDAFNVFNRVNYAGYVGNQSSPFFGSAVAARPVRRLQSSLRFTF